MENKLDVKMGEFMVAEAPIILQSLGIGSCVVVCLYDSENRIGGLAHIVAAKNKMENESMPMRFADKAIKMMRESIISIGGDKKNLTAKIVGGASMFPNAFHFISIGNDNIIAVRKELQESNIKIIAEDVGGNEGRSVWFDTSNGDLVVSRIQGETKMI